MFGTGLIGFVLAKYHGDWLVKQISKTVAWTTSKDREPSRILGHFRK
jgi:hypothetical protein